MFSITKSTESANSKNAAKPCCYRASCHADAGFCSDCGDPLVRCAAFDECGGLLDDDGCCSVCFSPELVLATQQFRQARVGDSVQIPLKLLNHSAVGRPVFVRGVWTRESGGPWIEAELAWQRVEAGQARELVVSAESIAKSGNHVVDIVIAIESRWQWRTETFAFSSSIRIDIADKKGDVIVNQNISTSAAGNQTGVTISSPVKIYNDDNSASQTDGVVEIQPLVRATVYDQVFGFRGTSNDFRVKRNAVFSWSGFSKTQTPAASAIVTHDGLLRFGRSRTKRQGGEGDVRILVNRNDGEVDVELSQAISREHFYLFIQNNRLQLRVVSPHGVTVDGKTIESGQVCSLKNGSKIHPLPSHPSRLELTTSFEIEHGNVVKVVVSKTQ